MKLLRARLLRALHVVVPYTRRLIEERYRGSVFGILWNVLTPMFMLLVYSVVFTLVFQARWHRAEESTTAYAIVLFSGLMLHSCMMESFTRSAHCVLQNPNFVKKVVFPLTLLVPCHLLAAVSSLLVSVVLVMGAEALTQWHVFASWIYVPVVLAPFLLMVLGLGWLLSAFSVYIRDIPAILPVAASLLLFTSTVFYPASALPSWIAWVVYLNPLTIPLEWLRHVLFHTERPALLLLGVYSAVSVAVTWLGYAVFRKLRGGFADVL